MGLLKRIFWLMLLCPVIGYAQKIDHTASFRGLNDDSYFRFSYDNDFFSANDYYYTQGYSFELAHSKLKKNPLNKLLVGLKDSSITHGVAFEHFGFTPTSIRNNEILLNDRPFAACIMLKSYKISTDRKRKLRLSSLLSTGVIGPAAFGGEMQETIHRWIGGVEPKGWNNQIRNGIILNYELNLEKAAYISKYLNINYNGNLRFGTLNTKAQSGLTVVAGKYYNAFDLQPKKKYQFYLFSQPLVNFTAHDASLQGDFFTKSPYTINSSAITRINFQNNFGAIVQLNKVYLEYYKTFISKEFETGKSHRWGGLKVGFLI
jgi:hypothetical protein